MKKNKSRKTKMKMK